MNSRIEQGKDGTSVVDIAKYVVALLLVAGGTLAFYWFEGSWNTALRIAAVVGGLVLGLGVFMLTAKGRETLSFLSEARFELRKVIWPTRQEAMRMTMFVIIAVIIASLFLAAVDFVIQLLIRWLLGH